MELGQKVKFKKYLKKNKYKNWYGKEISKKRNYRKYSTKELDENKEGIICGKRTIHYRGYNQHAFMDEPPEYRPLEYKEVYLIAVDMTRFYKVPKNWLKAN